MQNLNLWQIIFLALLQGVTELFPISSLGHTVILPGLFHWENITTDTACGGDSCFLPMITALHFGTCVALLIYFWRDWLQVAKTLVVSIKEGEVRRNSEEWVSWLIIIGTIPAAVLGVFLEKKLKTLFASPLLFCRLGTGSGSHSWLLPLWGNHGGRAACTSHTRGCCPLLLLTSYASYFWSIDHRGTIPIQPGSLSTRSDFPRHGPGWRGSIPQHKVPDEVL